MADPTRRPLVAGNWKMNGLKASAAELGKVMQGAGELWTKVDLMICPPATLIMTFAHVALGSKIEIGGQDSKFISIENRVVVDFAMNEACAAGTGSFLEEQAEKLGISIKGEFAKLALSSAAKVCL